MSQDLLKGCLDLLLLSAVAERPAHGYAIIAALRSQSAGAFDLPEGTVYPALHRLERTGLVRSSWAEAAGRRRRVYEITATGRQALAVRWRAWRTFSSGVVAVLGGAV